MNKIVLLSDKEQLSKGAFEFARMLNEQDPILLSGVFLPQEDYWNSLVYYSYGLGTVAPYLPIPEIAENQTAISQFTTSCVRNGIEYRVHEKRFESIGAELRTETRFADMLVFSNQSFYQHLDRSVSEEYTDEALHLAECPVVITPEHFSRPENIILAYDGSASSVYAIKQFAQLMPALAGLKTLLVYVNPYDGTELPHRSYIEELAARHYPNLTFQKLDIDPSRYFDTWMSEQKNAMLVAGSQGRNGISELFRKSFIQEVISEHMLPVFTAHR
jgi:hypothetical protein